MAKMNFAVSLSLLTKNFQNGIRQVQNSIRGLRAQFQGLMSGIGMGFGIQELVENARNLDKARTTLRNVSGSLEQFGENQEFVLGLSRRYNQELITLMGNYSKFYSAASYAGFALEEQQHIYESLTRAAAYFNLTADETNGVMLAVQQMISKGKVSSEELRRQLGERLPGAMNLAAKAMGVTTAELDEMIKDGRVMAKELLPLLASELNTLTANLDVNTIQGATNKLKNSFTELVDKMNVGDMYKRFLNTLSNGIKYMTDNLKKIASWIVGVGLTLAFKKPIESAHKSWKSFGDSLQKQLTESTARAKVLKKEFEVISKGMPIKHYGTGELSKKYVNVPAATAAGFKKEDIQEAQKLARAYNNELMRVATIQTQINTKTSEWVKQLGKKALSAIKNIGANLLYGAIAAGISALITLTYNWVQKLNEVKRKLKEIKSDLETDLNSSTPDISKAESLKLSDKDNDDTVKRERKIKEINKLLGREGDLAFDIENTNEEINAALEERIKNLKKILELEAKEKALSDMQSIWNEKAGENTTRQDIQSKYDANEAIIQGIMNQPVYGEFDTRSLQARKYVKENKQYKQLLDLYDEMEKLKGEIAEIIASNEYNTTGDGGDKNPEEDPNKAKQKKLKEDYDKIQKEHNNKLRALNEQLADEVISKEDYKKAYEDLYKSTLENIYALDNINENTDAFAKSILDTVKGFEKEDENLKKTNEALAEYEKEVNKVKAQFKDGLITQSELDDALLNLLSNVVDSIYSFGKLADNADELAEELKSAKRAKVLKDIREEETPKLGKYDSTLNYKKENSEIYADNAEYLDEYAKELDDYIERLKEYKDELSGADLAQLNLNITQLEAGMGILTRRAEDFAQAAKFAEVQEDIKKMKAELAEGIFDNISGIATAAERLTNSWKSLTETMEDPEVDGWTKFLTIFTTIMSTIETIVGVVKAFNAVMAIAEGLSLATAAAEQLGIPTKVQDAIATKAQAAAEKELATARHMAQAAALPYPANIAAIASTSAALAAAFAAIPQFSNGGYVGGNSSHGDKVLARLNSGELVLNKGQQSTLWDLLNGGGAFGGKSGNVSFEIKGDRLVGVLNNYNKKISK